jgi:hypothetical protein
LKAKKTFTFRRYDVVQSNHKKSGKSLTQYTHMQRHMVGLALVKSPVVPREGKSVIVNDS